MRDVRSSTFLLGFLLLVQTMAVITVLSSCGQGIGLPSIPLGISGATSAANTDGSVTVTLTGSGFITGITVTINSYPCTNVNVISSVELTCQLPSANIALVNIVATIPGGLSSGATVLSPRLVANDTSYGEASGDWASPENAKAEDGVVSSTQQLNASAACISYYLKATDFGFSIPAQATITGITVEVKKYQTTADSSRQIQDARARIVKDGTIKNTDRSIAGNWPMTSTYTVYGGTSDLWGETWTPSNINNSNFGFAIAAKSGCEDYWGPVSYIDHIRVTVSYR